MEADLLSKEALSPEEEGLYYASRIKGHANLFDRININ